MVTQGAAKNVLLDINYTHNSKGELAVVKVSSMVHPTLPESNYRRDLLYDGLGQLREDKTTYKNSTAASTSRAYVYDGNSNVISTTIDNITTLKTYNAVDQRTDHGFKYDLNGRQAADDQGRTYTYASDDQLTSVTYKGSKVSLRYHANGSLSSHSSTAGETNFFYDNGAINATQIEGSPNSGTSYLLASGSRLAAHSTNDANSGTYFIEGQGSTALELAATGDTASYYESIWHETRQLSG